MNNQKSLHKIGAELFQFKQWYIFFKYHYCKATFDAKNNILRKINNIAVFISLIATTKYEKIQINTNLTMKY